MSNCMRYLFYNTWSFKEGLFPSLTEVYEIVGRRRAELSGRAPLLTVLTHLVLHLSSGFRPAAETTEFRRTLDK